MFDYEYILNLLIEHFIDVANSIAGNSYPNSLMLRYGEPLAKKTLYHIVAAQKLCKESSFKHSKIELREAIDFSSISILTRAALESYLIFNHIFVAPTSVEEKELRNC